MRRQFSKELDEDRDFEIGGEVFTFRYPPWEEGAAIFDEDTTPSENGDGEFSWKADTALAIKRVPIFLEPGNDAHKRWKALTARKADPIPRHQIVELYRWLVMVTSGLPTNPPSVSEPGGGTSDSSSPEGSR